VPATPPQPPPKPGIGDKFQGPNQDHIPNITIEDKPVEARTRYRAPIRGKKGSVFYTQRRFGSHCYANETLFTLCTGTKGHAATGVKLQAVPTLSSCGWHRCEKGRPQTKRYTVFSHLVLKIHELMNLLSEHYMGLLFDRPVATSTQDNSLGCLGVLTVAWRGPCHVVASPLTSAA